MMRAASAITSIHARVRAAVFPARSIAAPNHNRTSTASLGAGGVDLSSLSKVDGTRYRSRPQQRAEQDLGVVGAMSTNRDGPAAAAARPGMTGRHRVV